MSKPILKLAYFFPAVDAKGAQSDRGEGYEADLRRLETNPRRRVSHLCRGFNRQA